jgi:hypothetical protein
VQDVKHTEELVEQDDRFLTKTSPDHRNSSTLNILPLYTPEERQVIRTFDFYTYTSVQTTASEDDNIHEIRQVTVPTSNCWNTTSTSTRPA